MKRSPVRRAAALTLTAGVAVAFTVVVLHGHGTRPTANASSSTAHVAAHRAATTPATTITFPVPMPTGTNQPLQLATDPSKAGVWFWASSPTDSRLYFWDATAKQLSSWSVGVTTQQNVGSEYGLAVDPQGQVWLGAENQLVRLSPTSGAVTRWTVPTAPQSAPTAAHQPPGFVLAVDIRTIAAAPDGTIALARAGSSTVQIFHPASQTFTTYSLPDAGDIQTIAVASDGTIAAAMADYAHSKRDLLDLISPAGKVTSVSVESDFVSAAGTYFVSGETAIEKIPITGAGMAKSSTLADIIPSDAVALSDGRVVVPIKSGLAILNVSSGAVLREVIPPFTCDARGIGVPPGSSPPAITGPGSCLAYAVAIAVDPANNVWFTDNSGRIGEVAAGSF